MSNKRSNWHLPEEVLGFLSSIFFMPVIAAIAVLAAMLLPSITSLGVTRIFWIGLAAGILGTVLLFLARLPLYRQRRFWTFGPGELDDFHRRLYWLAYLVVLVSMGLLFVLWLNLS